MGIMILMWYIFHCGKLCNVFERDTPVILYHIFCHFPDKQNILFLLSSQSGSYMYIYVLKYIYIVTVSTLSTIIIFSTFITVTFLISTQNIKVFFSFFVIFRILTTQQHATWQNLQL